MNPSSHSKATARWAYANGIQALCLSGCRICGCSVARSQVLDKNNFLAPSARELYSSRGYRVLNWGRGYRVLNLGFGVEDWQVWDV